VSAPRWCVVIVRGWVDGDEIKVRMLASGDVKGAVVRGSIASATEQLAAWLSTLFRDNAEEDASKTPP